MNQKVLFSKIINVLSTKYSIQSKLIPTYRYIDNNKSLYIILRYIKNTELNIHKIKDIFFSIKIDENFPKVQPYIRTLTNFSFPSLNDNSNLYYNLIHNKDDHLNILNEKDGLSFIEKIIDSIPLFIKKILTYENEKKFCYLGKYIMDEIYDMNDFFSSETISFYRAELVTKDNSSFKKYIILNDVYFLVFDPVPNSNNYGKLILQIDILLLNKFKENKDENSFNFELIKDNQKILKLKLRFDNKYKEFISSKNIKILNLTKKYNLNVDDYNLKETNSKNEKKQFIISKSFEYDILEFEN